MAYFRYERIFSRLTRADHRGCHFRHVTQGCRAHLPDLRSNTRTLSQTAARDRRSDATPPYWWAAETDRVRASRCVAGADCCCARRDVGRNVPAVAATHRRAPVAVHHEPRTCHDWLDTQKKTIAASERDEAQRCTFRLQILQHAAKQFVIVDESGYNLNLTPRYARAPRGTPAQAKVPRNVPANTTVIAALTSSGMSATMLVEGATDHHVVEAYVKEVLVPTLHAGQVVVLDNLRAHKRAEIEPQ